MVTIILKVNVAYEILFVLGSKGQKGVARLTSEVKFIETGQILREFEVVDNNFTSVNIGPFLYLFTSPGGTSRDRCQFVAGESC